MPMETARGIIQIESGKNYYWRATRARAGSFRGIAFANEEETRSREAENAGAGERERSKKPKRRDSRVVEKRGEGGNEGGGGGERRNSWESEEVR